ncbi:MAG: NTPase [Methylohalobius sp.]|nr:NTPase [Methylohalobius sp.]
MNTILLLTGAPGIGKTTLIKRIAARLAGFPLAGFYTEEIREDGRRVGFRLEDFVGGESGVIAHVGFPSFMRVGRYGVDVTAIDRLVGTALSRSGEVYLIDEIGKMECVSSVFVRCLELLLNEKKPLIATIAKQGGGFIQKVKRQPGIELWEVTLGNRDALVEQVLTWLTERGGRCDFACSG